MHKMHAMSYLALADGNCEIVDTFAQFMSGRKSVNVDAHIRARREEVVDRSVRGCILERTLKRLKVRPAAPFKSKPSGIESDRNARKSRIRRVKIQQQPITHTHAKRESFDFVLVTK